MEIILKREPKIRISYDEMEAYLLLPTPFTPDENHTFRDVMEKVRAAGVKIGVDEEKISAMIDNKLYEHEFLIAKGIDVKNGVDAYYDFNFDTNFNKVPRIREDGSVDYWSIHTIETVKEGQVIATYNEPIDGSNGMTVKGKLLVAKRGRPLPPLTGKGFERAEDNKTYVSTMDGKIEMRNNRILISNVYEVNGDVGLKTGNINFRGDVIIHGNVPTGAVIRATGSVTIDGTVDGAIIDANKDVIIRGGILGGGKANILTKGNLSAKFIEHARVKAHGSITTDELIDCHVVAYSKVHMKGRHASIIGGEVHAATGVEAYNFGNVYGIKTEIYAGVNMEVKKQIAYHESCITEAQDMIEKIMFGISQLDEAIKAGADIAQDDPRRASLLRTKIVKQAEVASHTQQLSEMNYIVECARSAAIKVLHDVHSGVTIGINDSLHQVKELQSAVAYVEREGRVVMYSVKDELV